MRRLTLEIHYFSNSDTNERKRERMKKRNERNKEGKKGRRERNGLLNERKEDGWKEWEKRE